MGRDKMKRRLVRISVLLVSVVVVTSAVTCYAASLDRVIRGKVVDSKGEPVRNAEVFWTPFGRPKTDLPGRSTAWEVEYASRRRTATVKSVRSGADGTFTIAVPAKDKDDVYADRLWGFSPGYSVAVQAIPNAQNREASIRLVLGEPSKLRVKVVLPDGNPARGATVAVAALGIRTNRCAIEEGELFFPPQALIAQTTSTADEHGMVSLPAWRHEYVARVEVTSPTCGTQSCFSRWHALARPEEWHIRLMPAGKLRGRVVADGPYSTSSLTVHIKTMSETADWSYTPRQYVDGPPVPPFMSSEATVTTDSEGRFEIPVMAYGWVDLKVQDGLNKPYQYADVDASGVAPKFEPATESELVFRLRKAINVRGRLVLKNTDEVPSKFWIACAKTYSSRRFNYTVAFLVDVDVQGNFSFYSLPGHGWIGIRSRNQPILGYAPLNWIGELPATSDILRQKEVTLNYMPGWMLSVPPDSPVWDCGVIEVGQVQGRVVTETGVPIDKAIIEIDADGVGGIVSTRKHHCTADENGRFCLWIEHFRMQFENTDHVGGVVTRHEVHEEVLPYRFRIRGPVGGKAYREREVRWNPDEQGGTMPDVDLSTHE